ncbi:MAG: hypothetical protein H6746_06780 [Deltaproteobacteria bacterium]|nr:hypothetical protein [Deltaproteobacteria bacterium]
MANTKNLSNDERKAAKREQRRALKAVFGALTVKQKKAFKASETKGLRTWIAEQQKSE